MKNRKKFFFLIHFFFEFILEFKLISFISQNFFLNSIYFCSSLTATNFMFMGMCRDRIKPRIDQLWRKVSMLYGKYRMIFPVRSCQIIGQLRGNPSSKPGSRWECSGSSCWASSCCSESWGQWNRKNCEKIWKCREQVPKKIFKKLILKKWNRKKNIFRLKLKKNFFLNNRSNLKKNSIFVKKNDFNK